MSELEEVTAKREALQDELALLKDRKDEPGVAQRIKNVQRAIDKIWHVEVELTDNARRLASVERSASNPRAVVTPETKTFSTSTPKREIKAMSDSNEHPHYRGNKIRTEMRDMALQVIDDDSVSGHMSAWEKDRLDDVLRRSDDVFASTAQYVRATAEPAYTSAFWKLLTAGGTRAVGLSDEESEAVRVVQQVDQMRASLATSSGAVGGYAVPYTLDPTVNLTNAGAMNPIRTVADVSTISGSNTWQGVSSAGVTAGFVAEATALTDGSPTLAQPTAALRKCTALVKYSIEIEQDWQGLQETLSGFFQDAKNNAESAAFATATGTAPQPVGILGVQGLTTAVRRQTASTAVFAVADLYNLKADLEPRYQGNSSFLMSEAVSDAIRQFDTAGGASLWTQLTDATPDTLIGRPRYTWSSMSATPATTGAKTILFGDFRQAFKIIDSIGFHVELIPHFLDATTGFPTLERMMVAWWRTGSGIKNNSAARYLAVL